MTEIEQLRANLETLRKAVQVSSDLGFPAITVGINTICGLAEKKIADLEAQQELVDPWKRAKEALFHWDANDKEPDYITKRSIFAYIESLQAKVDELNHELRCERINGGKVRDDLKAIDAKKNREKLAELTTILNAIPPACGLAKELVQKRIEGVKREIQNNG